MNFWKPVEDRDPVLKFMREHGVTKLTNLLSSVTEPLVVLCFHLIVTGSQVGVQHVQINDPALYEQRAHFEQGLWCAVRLVLECR